VLVYEVQREDSTLFSLISCFTYLRSATATISFEELEVKHVHVLPAIKEKTDYYKFFPIGCRVGTTTWYTYLF
jgi:hypothetical protein